MRIGFGASACARRENKKALIQIKNGGKIILKGTIGLSQGIVIIVDSGCLTLGNHFRCNYSTTIDCSGDNIMFGEEVVCGWNVVVKNNDGHVVINNGVENNKFATITIGNHVWLCANSTVLKGSNIGDHSVVAYGSLVTKSYGAKNALYAGIPAQIKSNNVNWKE